MHRVVITGAGAVTACGSGVSSLWQAARDGTSAVRECAFDDLPDQKVSRAAPVPPETKADLGPFFKPRFQDEVAGFALLAAQEAVAQAALTADDFGQEFGVFVGSGFGGAETLNHNYLAFAESKGGRMDPMSIPKIMTNASGSWLAMTYGAKGPTYCNSTACSSASQSIGLAYQHIRTGMIERAFAGGTEGCVVSGVFRAWEVLRVLSPTLCRPFSRDRNGMALGEGAGVLVLESLDSARARGATILAEVVGYGTTSDAGDLLRPDPEGAAGAMSKALRDANLAPAQVGYVNAHGTGTVANDVSEANAMRAVYGDAFDGLAVSSTKPVHGHALGAAGAIELIVAMQALREGLAPPNGNFTEFDPAVGFEPVHGEARPIATDYVMSNSFAFGGINATLILGRAPVA